MNSRGIVCTFFVASLLSGCAAPLIVGSAAGGVAVAQDRRSAGAMVDDETIELKATSALSKDAELERQGRFGVTSFNGVVLITGQAPDERAKGRASEIVKGIDRVRDYRNEMTIGQPVSLSTRSRDTFITGEVKSRLLKDRTTEGSKIKVVTEDGTVYLMGLVRRSEGDAAAAVTANTNNVIHVVKVFEYVD